MPIAALQPAPSRWPRRASPATVGNHDMLYAAYGSNLHPLRLERRTPSAACLGTARVAGYRDERLAPFDWYRDLVLLGCRRHDFPPGYLGAIEAVACRADSDGARRARNRRVVRLLEDDLAPRRQAPRS